MNMLQEKVARLKQQGDLNRSRWNPNDMPVLSGWPVRSYRWWQQETGYQGSDNLCHFIRVVLIWVPLRWITQPVRRIKYDTFLFWAWIVLIGAMIIAVELAFYSIHGLLGILIGNATIAGFGLAMWGVIALLGRYKYELRQAGKWFVGAHPERLPWLRPWLSIPVVIVCLAPFEPAALGLLIIWGVMAAVVGLIAGIGWLVNKQEAAYRRRTGYADKEVFLRALFAQLHPKGVAEQEKYIAWRERYIEGRLTQLKSEWGGSKIKSYEDVTLQMLLNADPKLPAKETIKHYRAVQTIYAREVGRATPKPPQPSRLRNAIGAVGQVCALVWTFVVISKWKVCPIIQLPDESVPYDY